MRVVLTQKMVVGHVMRYPGEVVEMPDMLKVEDVTVEGDPSTAAAASAQYASAQDDSQPETGRRRRKT